MSAVNAAGQSDQSRVIQAFPDAECNYVMDREGNMMHYISSPVLEDVISDFKYTECGAWQSARQILDNETHNRV